jgi:2'-5' RNA ligase
MRCFIGIDVPIVAIKEIQKIQKKLEPNFTGRLTSSGNLHLTIKFLGEIEEDIINDVKNRLSSITQPPFELTLKNVGVFSQKFIKIIWVKASEVPLQPLI